MTTILIIEDETPIRELISELLTLEDFEVLEAQNGLEGIELAQNHPPDLIICDVMMPELDGYGVLNYLQQNPVTRVIPFIFLTAKGTRQDQRYGMNLGADDYLIKPFSNEDLLDAIAMRLKKRENHSQRYYEELQASQEKIDYLMAHDSLTGLPNQLALREQFDALLKQSSIHTSEEDFCIFLLVLSVDRLQQINHVLGYDGGNHILRYLVDQVKQLLSPEDHFIRLNGNEFVVLIGQTLPKDQCENLTHPLIPQVLQTFAKPLILQGQEIPISVSLGITCYPHHGKTLDQLLTKAIAAKEMAKTQGGNQAQFYQAEQLTAISQEAMLLERDLRQALERKEFMVYYQPQIHLRTGAFIGAEALIRWRHPEQGFIPPGKFIPLAEKTGLIQGIGEWVLWEVGQQVKIWHNQGLAPLQVAVNLSALQFQDAQLVDKLQTLLTELELSSKWLELELTESILVDNVAASLEQLQRIKTLGIQVSMDDFGTGYSSLSYLQQFPFDVLKIDQCFIRNIDSNPKNAAIAKAIIQMAHQLNLQVIAEGVETEAELNFNQKNGCDDFQGYLVSPPVSPAKFEELLLENRRQVPSLSITAP